MNEPSIRIGERQADDVYIGRPGRGEEGLFGNPYAVGRVCSRCKTFHANAASTLPCFKAYFIDRVANDLQFYARVEALKGRVLWCPGRCKDKGRVCHGDVIVAWLRGDYSWQKTA